jgi:hypothetical protein
MTEFVCHLATLKEKTEEREEKQRKKACSAIAIIAKVAPDLARPKQMVVVF